VGLGDSLKSSPFGLEAEELSPGLKERRKMKPLGLFGFVDE
jgi:hypothetical protein